MSRSPTLSVVSSKAVSSKQESPIRGLPSTAAIFGHPIHPAIVPYPIAFLTGAFASDLASRATKDAFWGRASNWLLGAGIVTGLAAGAVGAIDYYTIRRARESKVGRLHAMGNPAALGLAAVSLALRRGQAVPGPGAIALTGVMSVLLGVTAWAGGELSYTHMVGVKGYDDQHTAEEKRHVA